MKLVISVSIHSKGISNYHKSILTFESTLRTKPDLSPCQKKFATKVQRLSTNEISNGLKEVINSRALEKQLKSLVWYACAKLIKANSRDSQMKINISEKDLLLKNERIRTCRF